MKSTFGSINTVVRGLYAQQAGLDTVGHNISNANTEGYSRQTVNLATTRPAVIYGAVGAMQLGTGVDITSITRIRDSFMDKQMWKESSTLGYSQTMETTMGKLENIFRDQLPDIGIQAAINKFWNTWQTLATNASNDSARLAVREQGDALVTTLSHAAGQIKNLIADINYNLDIKVGQINQIASELVSLNRQISNIEVGGRANANDLRDRRDLLIDQLSKLGNVQVYEDKDHNYLVQFGDINLVSATSCTKLDTTTNIDPYYRYEFKSVIVAGSSPEQTVNFKSGEMGALLGDPNHADSFAGLAGARRALDHLDQIGEFLLKDFNAIHKAGYGTDDSTGINFFDSKANSSEADTDYGSLATPPEGGWIAALRVNRTLYDFDGLAKIAAKSWPSLSVQQSAGAAGKANVGGEYNNNGETTFTVEIAEVDPVTGRVTKINYSDSNNLYAAGTAIEPINGTEDTFQLPGGLTIAIGLSTGNIAGGTYTFAVPFRGNASGDNAVKLANALKQDKFDTLGKSTLDEKYAGFVGQIGIQTQNAKRLSENQKTLVDQIVTWRESVSGVNVDEEMTNMIRFQKGYNAAARVMTTIDEMLDKLINGTGVVGR